MAISKITNESILDGEITDAKIAGVAAAKLTGTIANARISSASVVQHVPIADLSPVRSDILKLAIHQGVDGNRAAFNLDNSFIDTFEDDTGITTETDVDRDATGEYVNSITGVLGTPAYVTGDRQSTITVSTTVTLDAGAGNTGTQGLVNGIAASSNNSLIFTAQSAAGKEIKFDFLAGNSVKITEAKYYCTSNPVALGVWKWQGSADDTTYTDIGSSFTLAGAEVQTQTSLNGNTNFYRYYRLFGVSGSTSAGGWTTEVEFKVASLVDTMNATGTLISDAQTASTSRTSASGVMIYEDAVGTSMLGTDLKVYFSCNNSAWTEASSYGTATTYSGTKKLVKLGSTTVTAGTQVAMKAEWANQATESAASQLLIAQNVGTAIGNMTTNGGLAASFNGNKNQAYAQNSVCQNGNGPAFIGKDWGSGNTKTISGIKIWGSNETGYSGVGAAINFYLYGSNSAPTGTADGTLISTLATNLADVNGTNALEYLTGIDVTTAYRYHWFTITTPSSVTAQVIMCEIEFYALGTDAVAGKEVRLHGWAVNY